MVNFVAIVLVIILSSLVLLVCGFVCIISLFKVHINRCMYICDSCYEYCNRIRRRRNNNLEYDLI